MGVANNIERLDELLLYIEPSEDEVNVLRWLLIEPYEVECAGRARGYFARRLAIRLTNAPAHLPRLWY